MCHGGSQRFLPVDTSAVLSLEVQRSDDTLVLPDPSFGSRDPLQESFIAPLVLAVKPSSPLASASSRGGLAVFIYFMLSSIFQSRRKACTIIFEYYPYMRVDIKCVLRCLRSDPKCFPQKFVLLKEKLYFASFENTKSSACLFPQEKR